VLGTAGSRPATMSSLFFQLRRPVEHHVKRRGLLRFRRVYQQAIRRRNYSLSGVGRSSLEGTAMASPALAEGRRFVMAKTR